MLKLLEKWVDDFVETGSKWTWKYPGFYPGYFEFERALVRVWDSYTTYQTYWRIYRDMVGDWVPERYRNSRTLAESDSWCWMSPLAPMLAL